MTVTEKRKLKETFFNHIISLAQSEALDIYKRDHNFLNGQIFINNGKLMHQYANTVTELNDSELNKINNMISRVMSEQIIRLYDQPRQMCSIYKQYIESNNELNKEIVELKELLSNPIKLIKHWFKKEKNHEIYKSKNICN